MTTTGASTVTVVVPTFNRGEALRPTLLALLASVSAGLAWIEIIVVDDGSTRPAAPLVASIPAAAPFSLRCLRQANGGPGRARNTGLRAAHGRLVLFLDDDIVAPPNLIEQHVRAHALCPRTVVFGPSTLREPPRPTPLYDFLNSLSPAETACAAAEFVDVEIPASGHLSVERAMFDSAAALYRDDLSTPAAEEFELGYRLRRAGIRLVLAPDLIACHNQPLDLESFCRQQYKHALGTAEVIRKYPATRSLAALERIIRVSLEPSTGLTSQALKRIVLRVLASSPLRQIGLRIIERAQGVLPRHGALLAGLYRAVVSAYYYAGLRDGWRRAWS